MNESESFACLGTSYELSEISADTSFDRDIFLFLRMCNCMYYDCGLFMRSKIFLLYAKIELLFFKNYNLHSVYYNIIIL